MYIIADSLASLMVSAAVTMESTSVLASRSTAINDDQKQQQEYHDEQQRRHDYQTQQQTVV